MAELLIQGCSNTKRDPDAKLPAIELYDGYFYRIIEKAARTGTLRGAVDILILSAEHGLLDPETPIRAYDRRMTEQRARELNENVVKQLQQRLSRRAYERVWVNLGTDYQPAVAGFTTTASVPVVHLSGRLGKRGHQLKKILRADEPCPSIEQEC